MAFSQNRLISSQFAGATARTQVERTLNRIERTPEILPSWLRASPLAGVARARDYRNRGKQDEGKLAAEMNMRSALDAVFNLPNVTGYIISTLACAVLALIFGGGLFARPAIADDACPAGYIQNGMEQFDVSKPHCIPYGATLDKLLPDKAAHQEAAKPERQPIYNYCLLLHPGGEDC